MALTFSYAPLLGKDHIRILELAPSDEKTAEIAVAFLVASLESSINDQNAHPEFEALSYMWGDPTERADISLDGRSFSVSRRLHRMLQDLRDPSTPRRLWIDALCINQADIQERNAQVQLMRKIYRQARTVLIWLDHSVDISHGAFQMLQTIDQESTPSDLRDDPDFWDAVCEIFQDPYWFRVWIQQEISNAPALRLFCRDVELPVYSLYHLLRLFTEMQQENIMGSTWWDWAVKKPSVLLPPRFGNRDPRSQPMLGTTLGQDELNLLETLARTNTLKCTDDRDRVYGIMFLASDCEEGDVNVDYDLSITEVYTAVAEVIIAKYRSTRVLLYCALGYGAMTIGEKTPTWVPDWRRPPPRPGMSRFLPALNATSRQNQPRDVSINIVNGVLSIIAIRTDSLSRHYQDLFKKDLLSQSVSEFIETCLIITRDAMEITQDSISRTTDQGSQPEVHNLEETKQWRAVARTLGGSDHRDRLKHPDFDEILYKGAEELLRLSRVRNEDLDPGKCQLSRILNASGDFMRFGRVLVSFAWWSLTKQHAPFLTVSGRVGMAPGCAALDDEIWLVPGCELPVMLRQRDDGRHMVVGEVYLDGVNLWEPVGGMKGMHDVRSGEMINGYRVETVCLV